MHTADAFRERVEKQLKAQASDPFFEIRRQIGWLEQEIAKEMADFRTISHELKVLRAEVGTFVADYCLEVGEYAERLRYLSAELQKRRADIPETRPQGEEGAVQDMLGELDFSIISPKSVDMSADEVKGLYRRLAKVLHPDTQPENPRAAEMFALLNASYLSQDVTTLEYLKMEFLGEDELGSPPPEESPVQKLERLEQEYDAIKNSADRVRKEKHELVCSNGYKLHQYASWYRMCGENLIERITERMQSDIRRKELVLAGLQYADA